MSQKLEPMFLGAMASGSGSGGGAYKPPCAAGGRFGGDVSSSVASTASTAPAPAPAAPAPPPITLDHYPALRS